MLGLRMRTGIGYSSAGRPMKRVLAGILTALLIICITLAAMYVLVRSTIVVADMPGPVLRAVALGAELVLGIVLLVGTTYLATQLAVHIYGPQAGPPGNSGAVPPQSPNAENRKNA